MARSRLIQTVRTTDNKMAQRNLLCTKPRIRLFPPLDRPRYSKIQTWYLTVPRANRSQPIETWIYRMSRSQRVVAHHLYTMRRITILVTKRKYLRRTQSLCCVSARLVLMSFSQSPKRKSWPLLRRQSGTILMTILISIDSLRPQLTAENWPTLWIMNHLGWVSRVMAHFAVARFAIEDHRRRRSHGGPKTPVFRNEFKSWSMTKANPHTTFTTCRITARKILAAMLQLERWIDS